jgi:hypothetical protein
MTTGWLSHELICGTTPAPRRACSRRPSAGVLPPALGVQSGTPYENPESKRRFRNLVEVSGLIDRLKVLKPRSTTEDEIERAHTRAHIETIKAISATGGGEASYLWPFGRGSFEIALLSSGGAFCALDAVMRGEVKNAYALVRPPGHQDVPDLGVHEGYSEATCRIATSPCWRKCPACARRSKTSGRH